MMAALALPVFGADLALRTLSIVCTKAIENVHYFATTSHPGFSDWDVTLKRTDIKARIEKIQQLSVEFKNKEDSGHNFSPLIKSCIKGVNDVIMDINTVIEDTRKIQEYQETLYFNTWRFRLPDCVPMIQTLTFYSDLLKQRFDELEKMMSIVEHLNTN